MPASVQVATVPATPNSASSGWAATTRTRLIPSRPGVDDLWGFRVGHGLLLGCALVGRQSAGRPTVRCGRESRRRRRIVPDAQLVTMSEDPYLAPPAQQAADSADPLLDEARAFARRGRRRVRARSSARSSASASAPTPTASFAARRSSPSGSSPRRPSGAARRTPTSPTDSAGDGARGQAFFVSLKIRSISAIPDKQTVGDGDVGCLLRLAGGLGRLPERARAARGSARRARA